MEIPVLIEPVPAAGFRARTGEPLPLTADGTTRDEALGNLKRIMDKKLQNGSEVVALQVGNVENPWLRTGGMWSPDDPMIDEWLQEIEEYRRKIDEMDASL